MRTLLLLTLAIVAVPALALTPTAAAAGYCTNVTSDACPGTVCKWESRWGSWNCVGGPIIVCVTEPCW